MVVEPKVYAMLVSSSRGQILHIGVHFSLEEAYTVARERMDKFTPHKAGDPIDIELWNTLTARQVLTQIIESSNIDVSKKGDEEKPKENSVVDRTSFPQAIVDIISADDPVAFIEQMNNRGMDGVEVPIRIRKQMQPKRKVTASDAARGLRRSKNELMKRLIDEGNVEQISKFKDLLDANSQRYILNAIEKKGSINIKKDK